MARRVLALLALAAVVLTACRAPVRTEEPAGRPDPLVYRGQLVDVLPRDAIPSIDEPRFISPNDAGWLDGREPVISLEIGREARAYPVQILISHEIVNDVVGGRPVALTYCPLCNSALAFGRRVDGRTLEFGVSGKLYRSALVMYDRQTGSLWTHFEGLAVRGPLTGTRLQIFPTQLLSFAEWRRTYPRGMVLSRRTGHFASYGVNPYEGYDSLPGPYRHFFPQAVNYRLPPMQRVVGIELGGTELAVAYRDLEARRVVQVAIGGRRAVVLWEPGTASPLDSAVISRGRDVGSTGVFVPRAGGRDLGFELRGDAFVDRETGSVWTLTGRAVSGPLAGLRLDPLPHLDAFWFAWQAYHPDTAVYGVDS